MREEKKEDKKMMDGEIVKIVTGARKGWEVAE